jgi:hypothetical protein
VVTRRKRIGTRIDDDEDVKLFYAIQHLACYFYYSVCTWTCNAKAVSVVPLLVKLAIELGLFEEQYRGGLLCQDDDNNTVLNGLMRSDDTEHHNRIYNLIKQKLTNDEIERNNWECHEAVDDKYLQVLIKLRKIDLLKKEDIHNFGLLSDVCSKYWYFSEKRFRFLAEWDPSALLHRDYEGELPLHRVIRNPSIRGFQLVFEYGIRYFPEKKGINLLFRKTCNDITSFGLAHCQYGTSDELMKVMEDTPISSSSSESTPQLNIAEALIMAATDENIELDGVYFLLRREPDVLQQLLSSTPAAVAATMDSNNNIDNEKNHINNDNDENSNLSKTKTNPEKRRRKVICTTTKTTKMIELEYTYAVF